MRWSICVLGFAFVVGCQSAGPKMMQPPAASTDVEGNFLLVENGKSVAPIVVYEEAPPLVGEAAETLAGTLEKMSGARPIILEGEPDPLPDHAIWVGVQPVVETLFPEIDFEFGNPEEILIAANAEHLVIAGRDRWDPDDLTAEGRNFTIEGKQSEYGTVNAVYTFLQESLGVPWLGPGETGTDVLEQETIAVAPFTYRYYPQAPVNGCSPGSRR